MIEAAELVLFDAGGTLFVPTERPAVSYHRYAMKYGTTAELGAIERAFAEVWHRHDSLIEVLPASDARSEKEHWRAVVGEVFDIVGPVSNFDCFFDEVFALFGSAELWQLNPCAPPLLDELKRQGRRIGLVSNWDERLPEVCRALGVAEAFDLVLSSSMAGASKPDIRIFELALASAGATPERAVFVGDSLKHDVDGAAKAGIHAVWLSLGRKIGGRAMPTAKGYTIVADLAELHRRICRSDANDSSSRKTSGRRPP